MNKVLKGRLLVPDVIHGKSAYEIALLHGFEGTEAEWIESIAVSAKEKAVKEAAAEIRTEIEEAAGRAERAAEGAAEELACIIEEFTYDGRDYYADDGVNLFNIDDPLNRSGIWSIGGDGNPEIIDNANYRLTHPIKVYCGKRYRYTIGETVGVAIVVKLDIDGTPIGYVDGVVKEADSTGVFTADFTGFVSFTYSVNDNPMFCEEEKYPSEHIPFSRVLKATRLEKFREQFNENLKETGILNLVQKVQSANLLDLNAEWLNGYFSNAGTVGSAIAHADYKSYYVRLRGAGFYSFPLVTDLYGTDGSYKCAIFDVDKKPIGAMTWGVVGSGGELSNGVIHAVFEINEKVIEMGAAYIGVTVPISGRQNWMVVKGEEYPSSYIPYANHLAIDGLKIAPKDTTFFKRTQSANLLDLNGEFLDNCYFNINSDSGDLVSYNLYKSCYVPIRGSGTYSIPVATGLYGPNAISRITVFDQNKDSCGRITNGIQGTGSISSGITHAVFTITEEDIQRGVAYIGFTMDTRTSQEQFLMIVKGEEYPSEYIPYADYLEIEGLRVESEVSNPLKGKFLSVNGDSICAGAAYNGKGGYAKVIAENNGMTLQNIAEGGGTITAERYTDDGAARHWICRTIENMNVSADYAIVEGGVNDAAIGVPMGVITPDFKTALDDTTFCGAFESMLKQLTTRFAGKKIGYIAVHKMTDKFRSDKPDDGTSYYHAAKKCCEKWGVPFLDLNIACPPFGLAYDSVLSPLREAYTYNGDGWHPNEEGYKKYYVPKIEAWLKTL